jgi:hypothetical protein
MRPSDSVPVSTDELTKLDRTFEAMLDTVKEHDVLAGNVETIMDCLADMRKVVTSTRLAARANSTQSVRSVNNGRGETHHDLDQ